MEKSYYFWVYVESEYGLSKIPLLIFLKGVLFGEASFFSTSNEYARLVPRRKILRGNKPITIREYYLDN